MNDVANFLKNNPIMIACALVFAISIGYVCYQIFVMEAAHAKQVETYSKLNGSLKGIGKTAVPIPAETPGGKNETKAIVINQRGLQLLKESLDGMNASETAMTQYIDSRNKTNHSLSMDGVLPKIERDSSKLQAANQYRNALLQNYYRANSGTPMFNDRNFDQMGLAVTQEEVKAALDAVEAEFRQRFLVTTGSELTPEQTANLSQRLSTVWADTIRTRANQFRVYMPAVSTGNGEVKNFGAYSNPSNILNNSGNLPDNTEYAKRLWQAQRLMWVFEDLITAVNLVNRDSNRVPDSAVKRIVQIDIDQNDFEAEEPLARTPVKLDYAQSWTGRTSNRLYVVRYATIRMIVDSSRMDEVFTAFSSTNFMSPQISWIRDVDDLSHYQQGYYYGDCDAVEIELRIETLWFNKWMLEMMPPAYAETLGLK